MAGALLPQGSPVREAAKHGGAHQHPGHVDGLSQVAEGAGLTHQIPLQGSERDAPASASGRSTPPHLPATAPAPC